MNAVAHHQRSWLKDNFIGLILLAMVAAYFTYDLRDQTNNRNDHKQYEQDITDLKAITFNLVQTYNGKIQKDEKQDQEILDLWKCAKRSGGGNGTILKTK
jgi:hypothetical protein